MDGDVFVGGMRHGEIPGTGRLQRILLNENMEELRRESLLVELRHRIRVDGAQYVAVAAGKGLFVFGLRE